MKLVYKTTGLPVAIADDVIIDAPPRRYVVAHFVQPHKPSSEGLVTVYPKGNPRAAEEFYVSLIGAEWIEREDRDESPKGPGTEEFRALVRRNVVRRANTLRRILR